MRSAVTSLLLLLSLTLCAQKREYQVVVTDGGTRLAGTVVEETPLYLKLRITTPQVVTIRKADISSAAPAGITDNDLFDRNGYWILLSSSVLTGSMEEMHVSSFSVHLSNGYLFGNGVSLGLGTGLERFEVPLMPLYADLRFYPLKSRISPYVWVKGGWAVTFDNNFEGTCYYYTNYTKSRGGPMFNAGAGIELASWRRNAVTIGVGYRYQKVTFITANGYREQVTRKLDSYFNRAEVQLGFIFR